MRTRFVFTLVAASLGSMLILGAITYTTARRLLTAGALEQLEGLADTKTERVRAIVSDWQDRVRLAASPAQLRAGLREYNESPNERLREGVQGVLADALAAVGSFEALAVYDREGRLVASAERDGRASMATERNGSAAGAFREPVLVGTMLSEENPYAEFALGLMLSDEPVGVLHVTMDGGELLAATNTGAGPGQTGETLIVVRDEAGAPTYLTPGRFGPMDPSAAPGTDALATRALSAEGDEVATDLVDYRGETVWAAIRSIPETGWGLVVKVDASEEEASITVFREALTEVGTAMAAFAILLGIVVGFRFAKPIHELAGVATRIRDGELDARADADRDDEIGLFARTFNDMADELQRRMTLLREFKKFFDASIDMMCIANTDGYFKRINPAFERVLGWTTEQLIDRPFMDIIHPDDVEATAREIEKLSQGIPTISFENRFQCADGSYKHLLWTSYPEPESGLLYAIARDITAERVES
jgi:PAS domain S-box-containing protein